MPSDLDLRLRGTNIVQHPIPAPTPDNTLARATASAPRWRPTMPTRPLLIAALALGITGTATAAVVLTDGGDVSGLTKSSTQGAAAVGQIGGLLDRFDPGWATRDPATATPEFKTTLGKGGPITGTTLTRDGFQIEVATDSKVVCSAAHPAGSSFDGGLVCADVPIRFDSIPVATSNNATQASRSLLYAVGPDGVSDFQVTTNDGQRLASAFVSNVASVALPPGVRATSWSWQMPDGRRVTDTQGVGREISTAK